MITYQDFLKAADIPRFIATAVAEHRRSELYRTAVEADLYDRQRNVTINRVANLINGAADGAADNRLASNFFNRLNTQRCAYLLGNGVSFVRRETRQNADGAPVQVDVVKARLGTAFDTALYRWGYCALIHGVAFGFWNMDRLMVFPVTEFCPLWDEDSGALMAGIRFWQISGDKPIRAELYEPDGYTLFRSKAGTTGWGLEEIEPKRAYVRQVTTNGFGDVVAEEGRNYPGLPVVPMWGSALRQSTLVGMRANIDAYDLVQSGFANDLSDCAQIYWIIQNAGGMTAEEQRAFLEDIRKRHIAQVDTSGFDGEPRGALAPYVQDVPYQGRGAYLELAKARIYEDFGALDVHAIAASSTNDHIDAAYQPMDEQADQFEYQVIEAVQAVLRLQGIEDTPQFRRNRISNLKEQIEAVMLEAQYLDVETVLDLLPNISVDMKPGILARLDAEARQRLTLDDGGPSPGDADGGAEG